jgi:hypothetical protein
MNGDELSTKLSTGCGERTLVAVSLSTGENTWCRELVTVKSVGSRRSVEVLASFVLRRSDVDSALPEANSFLSECQQFCNIAVNPNLCLRNRSRRTLRLRWM